MDDLNRPGPTTTDPYNQRSTPPEARSGFSSMYLVLGALVVAVAVLAFAFSGSDTAQDGRAGTDAPITQPAPDTMAPNAAPTAPDAPAAPGAMPPADGGGTAPGTPSVPAQ